MYLGEEAVVKVEEAVSNIHQNSVEAYTSEPPNYETCMINSVSVIKLLRTSQINMFDVNMMKVNASTFANIREIIRLGVLSALCCDRMWEFEILAPLFLMFSTRMRYCSQLNVPLDIIAFSPDFTIIATSYLLFLLLNEKMSEFYTLFEFIGLYQRTKDDAFKFLDEIELAISLGNYFKALELIKGVHPDSLLQKFIPKLKTLVQEKMYPLLTSLAEKPQSELVAYMMDFSSVEEYLEFADKVEEKLSDGGRLGLYKDYVLTEKEKSRVAYWPHVLCDHDVWYFKECKKCTGSHDPADPERQLVPTLPATFDLDTLIYTLSVSEIASMLYGQI